MGFPSAVSYGVILPTLLWDSIYVVAQLKFLISWALSHLDLVEEADDDRRIREANAQTIKKALSVVDFGSFVDRYELQNKGGVEESVCAVCLCGIERRHQVRELCNCRHAFHKGCLDKWVEQGQQTCPLCRSQLMPPCCGFEESGEDDDDSWLIDRISYLFGEDLLRGV